MLTLHPYAAVIAMSDHVSTPDAPSWAGSYTPIVLMSAASRSLRAFPSYTAGVRAPDYSNLPLALMMLSSMSNSSSIIHSSSKRSLADEPPAQLHQ